MSSENKETVFDLEDGSPSPVITNQTGEAKTKRTVYERMYSLFATDVGVATPKDNVDTSDVVLKLPALTVIYWCEKMTATTFGETFADYFTQTMDLGYAPVAIGFLVIFCICLGSQLYVKTYWPALFWLTMGASSLVGTCISDFIDRSLHWGYPTGMAVLLSIVLGILGIWKLTGEPMNVAGVMTRRAEFMYWSVILFSNTLGTALGDFMSDSLEWGYAMSAGIVGGILGLCAILACFTNFNKVREPYYTFTFDSPHHCSHPVALHLL
jgi:uncharacterized membrane-anchored protein